MRHGWRVRVVVPARDEEDRLPSCLAALDRAVRHLRRHRPLTRATVTVVLDSCRDSSADVVDADHRAQGLVVDVGRVGAARAAGIAHATRHDRTAERVWLACTDADTVVPRDWLTTQLDLADAGHEVVLGTVEPDPEEAGPLLASWCSVHVLADGHPHVHGANLGLSLAAYRAAGGFAALDAHEDRALVERLRSLGLRIASTDATRVVTSARTTGRAPGGFAAYLRALDASATHGRGVQEVLA